MELSNLLASQGLTWKHTRFFKREYELQLGHQTIAKLYWPKALSQQAIGEMGGESWTFERKGILHPKTTILKIGDSEQAGSYETANMVGKGFLTLNHGVSYQWTNIDGGYRGWVWQELYGTPVVTFKPKSKWTYSEWLTNPEPSIMTSPNLNLLMVFGFYLILKSQEQGAAGSTSSASSV